jgi:hypothetical protein
MTTLADLQHTNYTNATGAELPSVTTIITLLDKGEGLIRWAHNLGKQGLDYETVRNEAANLGKLVHHMVENFLLGKKTDITGCDPVMLNRAAAYFQNFITWWSKAGLEVVCVEKKLISTKWAYGGTIDIVAKNAKGFYIIDLKTSGKVYDSYWLQLAAYKQLWDENFGTVLPQDKIRKCCIMHVGGEQGAYKPYTHDDVSKEFHAFCQLRILWDELEKLKGN